MIDIEGPVQIIGTIETVGAVVTVEEVTGVIQTQAQKMIDKCLGVEIVLEVGLVLEVEGELSRPVFIATNQTMTCLIVIDFPKT